MTRLCILLTALAVIARTRVALLPGWVVPLPALLAAVLALACVTVLALAILRMRPAPAPAAVPEPAGAAGGVS
jgi:hypothetical protein